MNTTTPVKGGARVLKVGAVAPAFSLESSEGGKVSKASLKGTRFVLYFYPKDMTSGCTVEAQEFTLLFQQFQQAGVAIYGVSPDTVERHAKFIAKEGITFPLLADPEHKAAEVYGVWGEKTLYGKKYQGIFRTTFVIDAQGKIERIYRDVKPKDHATCVLADLALPA